MEAGGAQLAARADAVERGALRAVIDRVFRFADVDEAMAYAETGHATGKVVITRYGGA